MSKNKRLLTLDDLVQFCQGNQLTQFSAAENGAAIFVQIPTQFEETSSDPLTLYGRVKLMHSGENRNKSNVTDEALKNCLSKIKYKPFLASFTDINGEKDFTSHEVEYVEDEDGNTNIVYVERQVGCFTADEPVIEFDEELQHNYVYAYVAIPREYTDAAAIIERKGGTKVSAELMINKMSYDADTGLLDLEDIEVMGATALGTDPDTGEQVQEGMEGARLDIVDFSENNRVRYSDDPKLVEVLTNLVDERIQAFFNSGDAAQNLGKEVQAMQNENPVIEENTSSPRTFTLTLPDGTVKNFELSLDQIHGALYELVNATYGNDDDWYGVQVYPDSSTIVMINYWKSEAYRQEYSREDDNFALVGERVAVESIWVTAEEKSALDQLKAEKAELESKLADVENLLGGYQAAEAEANKVAVLNNDDYAVIRDSEEYNQLVEDHANYSVEEITDKLNSMLLAYAKKQFAAKPEAPKAQGIVIPPVDDKKKRSPYGGLFD